MEILKPGNLNRTTLRKKFECDRCGCAFVATNSEYQLADCMESMLDGIAAKCKCPTCGGTVYLYR